MIFTHWWLVSVAIATPHPLISAVGLTALLLAPLLLMLTSVRQLRTFVPGGLSWAGQLGLYLQSFVSIWLYCLPVVTTQLYCALGFRSKFFEWKPTQKPQYDNNPVLGN